VHQVKSKKEKVKSAGHENYFLLLPFAFCLMAMNIAGCGYQFQVQGAGPTVGGTDAATARPGPPLRMVVRTFENRTLEANLEIKLTNYMRREFSGTGTQIVGESEPADLLLTGQVLGITMPTLSFDQTTTFESRIELLLTVKVEEIRSKKVIWTQIVKGASEFFITQDLQFNRVLQNRALEQAGLYAAGDLASRYSVYLESGQLDAAMTRKPTTLKSDSPEAPSIDQRPPAN